MSAPQWLIALGIPESCISPRSSAAERGRSFSVIPQPGDHVWRVQVDDCWLRGSEKRMDYLFWGESASGRKIVLLVELKGRDSGHALEQIKNTLDMLCKQADGQGIHTGLHAGSPGHDRHDDGGVRAYIVLSGGASQRQPERKSLWRRYGVLVHTKTKRLEVNGIDNLP